MMIDEIFLFTAWYPQNPAILALQKQPLPYFQLGDHLNRISSLLHKWNFSPEDRIALVLPNGPEAATAFLAISSVCACAPLNPGYPQSDFVFSMQDLHVKALVTSFGAEHPAQLAASALRLPVIHLIPHPEIAGLFDLESEIPFNPNFSARSKMGSQNIALVLHTSGTTSRPKIVPITHENLIHSTRNIAETYQLGQNDRCLNMMPLFHVHGLIAAVAATLTSGGSVICTGGFDPAHITEWLVDLQPTWYTAVPTLHQAVLDHFSPPDNLSSLKIRFIRSCSSALSPQLAEALSRQFHVPVLEAYGMTEGTHQIASNPLPPNPAKMKSVGMATGTTRVTILDEQGEGLKPGEIGEICIRGENVILEYENNPAANESNFHEGWLRTGDQGYLDDDGYLFITGRIKELINRGGEKISPREIDEILQQIPAVKQAVAFPIPHPTLGEDIAAAVVLKPGQEVSTREIRQYASSYLADYKIPRVIVFLSEIPKGPTGKVQRLQLAKQLEKEIASARDASPANLSRKPTQIEKQLITIWSKILKLDQVEIEDDFLALGGDSLMATQVLQAVHTDYGITLTMIDLFEDSSLAGMANRIQQKLKITGEING
jgi:acyl-CoA synthetase (AMP-forming)/AMP-acid ligase II/acyl carrier protein